ncbi:hypothetical protein NECAME_02658 [Necator americanus]|uniref:Uncharacterized protein n=1 Tax=Necator americanus TaxID=51031 RepID=W2TDY3_NECAM|nr:hypothetical protein NECAME_02658 [Necator americanus]ETN79232.1 hypothetical protein NECAME_02658 [Necator americanus]
MLIPVDRIVELRRMRRDQDRRIGKVILYIKNKSTEAGHLILHSEQTKCTFIDEKLMELINRSFEDYDYSDYSLFKE